MEPKIFTWVEVESIIGPTVKKHGWDNADSKYPYGHDMKFFEYAFKKLEEKDLNRCTNRLEELTFIFRLLTIMAMYRCFLSYANIEPGEVDLTNNVWDFFDRFKVSQSELTLVLNKYSTVSKETPFKTLDSTYDHVLNVIRELNQSCFNLIDSSNLYHIMIRAANGNEYDSDDVSISNVEAFDYIQSMMPLDIIV